MMWRTLFLDVTHLHPETAADPLRSRIRELHLIWSIAAVDCLLSCVTIIPFGNVDLHFKANSYLIVIISFSQFPSLAGCNRSLCTRERRDL